MKAFRSVLLFAVLNSLLSGCAATRMYPGDLPREEVALIKGMNPLNPSSIMISARVISIDGIDVPGKGYKVALLPGYHKVVYQVNGTTLVKEMEFKAGHTYRIFTVHGGGQVGDIH